MFGFPQLVWISQWWSWGKLYLRIIITDFITTFTIITVFIHILITVIVIKWSKTDLWTFFLQDFILTFLCLLLEDLVNDLTREMVSKLPLQAVVTLSGLGFRFLSKVWKNITWQIPRIWFGNIGHKQCFESTVNVAIHTCFNWFNLLGN